MTPPPWAPAPGATTLARSPHVLEGSAVTDVDRLRESPTLSLGTVHPIPTFTELAIARNELDGDARTIVIIGEIDLSNAEQFTDEIRDSLDGVTMLSLDMTDVTYLDSAGIRMLLRIHETTRDLGVSFVIELLDNSIMHRLLDVSGLVDFLPLRLRSS